MLFTPPESGQKLDFSHRQCKRCLVARNIELKVCRKNTLVWIFYGL